MILGIAEDFTNNTVLDSELLSKPTSGLYLNSGVHPLITVDNLLSFLPVNDITFSPWDISKQYDFYQKTRSKKDIVSFDGKVWQCIDPDGNIGVQPDSDELEWMETNIESLRMKSFIYSVQDTIISDLNLTKRLINNQQLYEQAYHQRVLPNDYCGWVFQAKGSDYVTITINQASIQMPGTAPVSLYVINQGKLVDTLTLTPANGTVNFQPLNYSFKGQGEWKFVIDSTIVFTNNAWIDGLKYDGFVCYTCVGIGESPETARYSRSNISNGLGFNVSVYLDPELYLDNNLSGFGPYVRSAIIFKAFEMFQANSNNRENMNQRIGMANINLIAEIKQLDAETAISTYKREKKAAINILSKTFDTQLNKERPLFQVTRTSV